MGYYTDHKISILDGDVDIDDLAQRLEDMTGYHVEVAHKDAVLLQEAKWYECEEDMKALSRDNPHIIFLVEGEGEENGDIWRAFVKDGQWSYQKVQYTWPDPPDWAQPWFNESTQK
jgi:hypothetical protein